MKEESELKNYCTLTDSELVEKAEQWLQRLINTGGRDWSLPVPANPNKDVDLVIAEIIHRFKKDRPTPPVEAKTAEEITLEQLLVRAARYGYEYHETTKFPEMLFDENCKNNFLQFLQSNKAYKTLSAFTPSAKSVEVEEAKTGRTRLECPNCGSDIEQADTISRLRGDMEWIAKFCNDPACKRLAKEALKEKES